MALSEEQPDPQPEITGEKRSLAGRLLAGGAGTAQRAADATGLSRTLETAIEEAIVKAVESEATERAVTRILNGPAIEQAVEQALRSPAVEQAVIDVVDSDLTEKVWGRILDSDETQRLIERIARSPEIRSAIAAQGVGLVDQLGAGVASVSRLVDSVVERIARRATFRKPRAAPTDRVGLVTRALALAIDALVINLGLVSAGAILDLLASFAGIGLDPESRPLAAIGAMSWFALSSAYLFTFWAISGQTPGMRFLNIRVEPVAGTMVGPRSAFRRLVGFWLAIIPFCLGFLGVLLRNDRRGFHDRLGRTVVRYQQRDAWGRPVPDPESAPAAPTGPAAAAVDPGSAAGAAGTLDPAPGAAP